MGIKKKQIVDCIVKQIENGTKCKAVDPKLGSLVFGKNKKGTYLKIVEQNDKRYVYIGVISHILGKLHIVDLKKMAVNGQ